MIPSSLPGGPNIGYRGPALYVDDVRLDTLAREHGTPLFVYSQAAILASLAAYQRALQGRQFQICYAMKANSCLLYTSPSPRD